MLWICIVETFSFNSTEMNICMRKKYMSIRGLDMVCSLINLNEWTLSWGFISLKKSKATPLRGSGGPQSCERSRLAHFLGNQLRDGSRYSFLLESEKTPGP
jgi:hypothetical protein